MNTKEPDQPVMYTVRRNMYMPGITRVPIDIFGDIRERKRCIESRNKSISDALEVPDRPFSSPAITYTFSINVVDAFVPLLQGT